MLQYIKSFFLVLLFLVLFLYYNTLSSTVYCDSNELVLWGDYLISNVGKPRFSKLVSSMVQLPPYIFGLIVGLILSDGYLGFSSSHHLNTRLVFGQSVKHSQYFWFVFNQLAHYCSKGPYVHKSIRKGSQLFGLYFHTRALPCFTELHSLFSVAGVKTIPENIYELLTPVALAHWIQGDGTWDHSGVVLCTDSFTIPDVVRLMNVLIIRYNLDCTLRSHVGSPRIYIRSGSMPTLRLIVIPHMNESMLGKLGIKATIN